ncbi:hypothetical protein DEU56DRAFT_357875 [Suillus clintonianus]|uniref:uncharacterized protein n=1 Tax=Suillus clintonianus TaxID=1904413 RepID=UPI001B8797BE|nr:uncharacterized protein DEU56DRAFT_357875 [Suillus clintonianus]KAG2136662.1 hypothetical protein DEU56DRAFT_357875 [Suillus clintonianus]
MSFPLHIPLCFSCFVEFLAPLLRFLSHMPSGVLHYGYSACLLTLVQLRPCSTPPVFPTRFARKNEVHLFVHESATYCEPPFYHHLPASFARISQFISASRCSARASSDVSRSHAYSCIHIRSQRIMRAILAYLYLRERVLSRWSLASLPPIRTPTEMFIKLKSELPLSACSHYEEQQRYMRRLRTGRGMIEIILQRLHEVRSSNQCRARIAQDPYSLTGSRTKLDKFTLWEFLLASAKCGLCLQQVLFLRIINFYRPELSLWAWRVFTPRDQCPAGRFCWARITFMVHSLSPVRLAVLAHRAHDDSGYCS